MMMVEPHEVLDFRAMHRVAKKELYAYTYGRPKPTQDRIDEEGCGAVFAAATLRTD